MQTTAADLNEALDIMNERVKRWNKEHPNEKMPVCPHCNNIGLIRRCFDEFGAELFGEDKNKAGSYDYWEPCTCVNTSDNKLKRNNRKYSEVPRYYEDAYFNNFDLKKYKDIESKQLATCALNDAKHFVKNFEWMKENGKGLYIYSEARGCGKTRLASSITNELMKNDIRVKFTTAGDVITEIKRAWDDETITEAQIIKKFVEPTILIIDDLGTRSGKDWIDEKFLLIIDARYREYKMTIFTSNYEVEKLPFRDTRIIDRLSEGERFHLVKMPNETLRRKSKDNFYEVPEDWKK